MSQLIRSMGQQVFVFGTKRTQIISLVQANTSARNYYSATSFTATFNRNRTNNGLANGHSMAVRNLYSESSLGIDKLERIQERKEQLFAGPAKDRYVQRLRNYVDSGDSKSLFIDDLINLIGITESDEHLDLLEKVVVLIEDQDLLLKGWGTTLMRLYYKMNQLDRAIKNLHDVDRFDQFFNQRACYKVVMTMLFNAGKHREVIDTYHQADKRLIKRNPEEKFRYLATLAFASLARINTPEALAEAEKLFAAIDNNSVERRSLTIIQFLAYLAVNNGKPNSALNQISNFMSPSLPIGLKDLKIQSLIKLERYEDILIQLREYVSRIRRDMFILTTNTYKAILETLDKIQDKNVRQELSDILVEIKEGGHVTDASIEDLLFKELIENRDRPINTFDQGRSGDNSYRPRLRYNEGGQYRNNYNYNSNYNSNYNYNNNYNNDRQRSNATVQQRFNRQLNDEFEGQEGRGERRGSSSSNSGRRFTYQNEDFSS